MIRVYIMIIVVGLVGGVVYGGYAYYQDTQQRLKTLQQNNAKLEVAVKSKDEALNFMTSNFEKQSKLNNELSGKLADAEKENTVIRDKLAKSNLAFRLQRSPTSGILLLPTKLARRAQRFFDLGRWS